MFFSFPKHYNLGAPQNGTCATHWSDNSCRIGRRRLLLGVQCESHYFIKNILSVETLNHRWSKPKQLSLLWKFLRYICCCFQYTNFEDNSKFWWQKKYAVHVQMFLDNGAWWEVSISQDMNLNLNEPCLKNCVTRPRCLCTQYCSPSNISQIEHERLIETQLWQKFHLNGEFQMFVKSQKTSKSQLILCLENSSEKSL